VGAVSKALPRIRENCPTLAVVITSRPAAFANSPGFDASTFPHIELLSVKRAQINLYAKRWMDVRGLSPKERTEFTSILEEKMNAPHLRDLSRNPMQLTILLSLILTQGAALPDKRTNLYDEYVDLFFSRESAKSQTVRKHIVLLKDLHRFLGWTLHANAETNRKKSSGRISTEELQSTLHKYLRAEGHPTEVVEEIFGAMLERVVMIVPRIQGTYEFEVQPLREYFAARFLYDTAPYSPAGKEKKGTKPDRFDAISRNFYWLNVVRFFAGCFSKGELLDLADRVKALIEDPNIGKSRHPIGLTAMLLADWVFEQSPKAVAQLTDILATPSGMRRMTPAFRSYSTQEIITLPKKSGGEAVFESAFALMEATQTPDDRRRIYASVASAQASDEECDKRWLCSQTYNDDPTRWLIIGRSVGTLARIEENILEEKLRKLTLNRVMARILIATGRSNCAFTSDHNAQLIQNVFLSERFFIPRAQPAKSPLYLIPHLFFPFGWLRLPERFREQVEAFKNQELSDTERKRQSDFPFAKQCYDLSIKMTDLVSNNDSSAKRLEAYDSLLEECRKIWGARPAIVIAQIDRIIERRVNISSAPTNFFDPELTTAQRLRSAKAKRTNPDWWSSTLSQSETQPRPLRSLLLLALFAFVPLPTLVPCEKNVEIILSAMDDEEWSSFVYAVSVSGRWMSRRETIASEATLALNNERIAYIIATKEPEKFGQQTFLRYFREYTGPFSYFLSFKQSWALKCAFAGTLDWIEAIDIIKQTYSLGIDALDEHQLRSVNSGLPAKISSEVLLNSQDYPLKLLDAAENAALRTARKAIRPVGSIAKIDRWFSFG
jgi:hypothetical protein